MSKAVETSEAARKRAMAGCPKWEASRISPRLSGGRG